MAGKTEFWARGFTASRGRNAIGMFCMFHVKGQRIRQVPRPPTPASKKHSEFVPDHCVVLLKMKIGLSLAAGMMLATCGRSLVDV